MRTQGVKQCNLEVVIDEEEEEEEEEEKYRHIPTRHYDNKKLRKIQVKANDDIKVSSAVVSRETALRRDSSRILHNATYTYHSKESTMQDEASVSAKSINCW